MKQYLVQVYTTTGEQVSFITEPLDDDPFDQVDIDHGEHLYFNFKDHKEQFDILLDADYEKPFKWYVHALWFLRDKIVSYTVHPVYQQCPDYIGLTRDEASAMAMESGRSFRVVFEDGISFDADSNYDDNRVNIYINQDRVYKAELY